MTYFIPADLDNPRACSLPIGDTYQDVTYSYCEDDNTYTPHFIERTAWACALRSRLTWPEPDDLFAEMFGD